LPLIDLRLWRRTCRSPGQAWGILPHDAGHQRSETQVSENELSRASILHLVDRYLNLFLLNPFTNAKNLSGFAGT
jgi:hypothetical protein